MLISSICVAQELKILEARKELLQEQNNVAVSINKIETEKLFTVGFRFLITNKNPSEKLIIVEPAHIEQIFSLIILDSNRRLIYHQRKFPNNNPPKYNLVTIKPNESREWTVLIYQKPVDVKSKLPPPGFYSIKINVSFSYFYLSLAAKELPSSPSYQTMQLKFPETKEHLDFNLYNVDVKQTYLDNQKKGK